MRNKYPIDFVPETSYLTFLKKVSDQMRISGTVISAKGLYRCKCGAFVEISINAAKMGSTKSCGCIKRTSTPFYIHGFHKHPLYFVWSKIKSRCYGVNEKSYPNYGGRGVIMCDEWLHNPERFIKWALENGWQKGLQVDKDIIPKKLGIPSLLYSPKMCSIVTAKENNLAKKTNRIVEYNLKKQTVKEWSIELDKNYSTLYRRLQKDGTFDKVKKDRKEADNVVKISFNGKSQSLSKWAKELGIGYVGLYDRIFRDKVPIEDALTRPKNFNHKVITHNGITQSLTQWCKELGILKPTLNQRLRKGMSVRDAFTLPIQTSKRNTKCKL